MKHICLSRTTRVNSFLIYAIQRGKRSPLNPSTWGKGVRPESKMSPHIRAGWGFKWTHFVLWFLVSLSFPSLSSWYIHFQTQGLWESRLKPALEVSINSMRHMAGGLAWNIGPDSWRVQKHRLKVWSGGVSWPWLVAEFLSGVDEKEPVSVVLSILWKSLPHGPLYWWCQVWGSELWAHSTQLRGGWNIGFGKDEDTLHQC